MEEKPVPSSSREETGRRASGRKGCCGIAGYKTTGNGTKEFPIPVKPKSDSYPRPGVLYRLRSGSSLGGRIARGAFSSGPAHFYWKINDNGKKSFKLVGNECFFILMWSFGAGDSWIKSLSCCSVLFPGGKVIEGRIIFKRKGSWLYEGTCRNIGKNVPLSR